MEFCEGGTLFNLLHISKNEIVTLENKVKIIK
jgi:hypothetical protein